MSEYHIDDMMLDIQMRVPLNDIKQKIRAEAIEECIKVMKYSWYNGQQPLDALVRRLEQLKEQSNEKTN